MSSSTSKTGPRRISLGYFDDRLAHRWTNSNRDRLMVDADGLHFYDLHYAMRKLAMATDKTENNRPTISDADASELRRLAKGEAEPALFARTLLALDESLRKAEKDLREERLRRVRDNRPQM